MHTSTFICVKSSMPVIGQIVLNIINWLTAANYFLHNYMLISVVPQITDRHSLHACFLAEPGK